MYLADLIYGVSPRAIFASDQRGVAAEGVRDSGAYEFTGAMNALKIEKLINHRVSAVR